MSCLCKSTVRLKKVLITLTDNQDPNVLYFEMKILSETHHRKQNNNP